MNVYLESDSSGGGKFWKLVQRGKSFTTTYGKVGNAGTSSKKTFTTGQQCEDAARKLISTKKKKGYASAEEDEDEDVQDSPPPKKRGRKRRTPDSPQSSPPAKRRRKAPSDDEDDEDDDDEKLLEDDVRIENEDTEEFWEIEIDEKKKTYQIRAGTIGRRGRKRKPVKFGTAKEAKAAAYEQFQDKKDEWGISGSDDEEEGDDDEEPEVFDGLAFSVSGTLTKSRKETQALIKDNGGVFKTAITNAVDYLVVRDNNVNMGTGKCRTAQTKGIKVVVEDFLYDSVNDGKLADEDDYIVKLKKKTKAASTSKGSSSRSSQKKTTSTSGSPSKSRQKKMVVKGRCAVDDSVPGHERFHVYEEPNCVWDAMLNQTNINANNNKFYKLQVLETDAGGQYHVWFHWGRVGYAGQNTFLGPYGSPDKPKKDFMKKFSDKTKNDWSDRQNFQYAGKYTYLPMDYSGGGGDGGDSDDDEDDEKDRSWPDSELAKKVQDLVKLIFDKDMFEAQMKEIGFDCNKLPLGKVTKKVVTEAFEVLKEMEEIINGEETGNLAYLSSRFYTLIPHEFGFSRPPTIKTKKMLSQKLELVESLGQIQVAEKLLKGGKGVDRNPIDTHYDQLKAAIIALEPEDDEFKMCVDYTRRTHGVTHNSYTLTVEQVFKLDRDESDTAFGPFAKDNNRMLLWHGSRLTNFVGIISQGLRIAPPEAPVTGYMFGKGVYFADMVSKSANYCRTSSSNSTGLMLLCEVALGGMSEKLHADYYAGNLPAGKLSTKGMGKYAPDPASWQTLPNGCVVPVGDSIDNPELHTQSSLLYNEFIVYDTAQIKMRYLLKMNFNFKSSW